mmetsp:Transcript_11150/g.18717  ORF Transcript_11150/g.18717 Transcript_11150/m.18717 type:complete len:95 (-) Transcript_11150:951-1235(-)
MEKNLAKEIARLKIDDEKKRREVEKICGESDELKELQAKIRAAYLNKERSAQITETQHRKQFELEKDSQIEVEMLRLKEEADRAAREKQHQKQE